MWDLLNERVRQETKRRGTKPEKVVRELVHAMRQTLEMRTSARKGVVQPIWANRFMKMHLGSLVPRAPLRAFRYTTAGGGASKLREDGWPRSSIFKAGFGNGDFNPFSGKVIIMDEVCNLVRHTARFEDQMGRLRTYLYAARRTVLAGFTGSIVGSYASDRRRLLDIVKGESAVQGSDEGFISSFRARDSPDFPEEVPVKGVLDGILHEGVFDSFVRRHTLHGEALKRYMLKEVEYAIVPRLLRLPEEKRYLRLSNYCNVHVARCSGAQKDALLKDVKEHAPKLHAVAKSVSKSTEKAVVMLGREMGYKIMLEVLTRAGKRANFRVATLEELADYNDPRKNLRGERFRVMIAGSSELGEGVQFKGVRRLYIVDVPLRLSDLMHRASRCVQFEGHADLPPAERKFAVELHMAHLPKFLKQAPGSLIYLALLNTKENHNSPGACLEAATLACLEELQKRGVRTLEDLQKEFQGDNSETMIDLLSEIVLENLGVTSDVPARPLAMILRRLGRGGDDVQALGVALAKGSTADEVLWESLVEQSAELIPPVEALRAKAVDHAILAPKGAPPKGAPPKQKHVDHRAEIAASNMQKGRKALTAHAPENVEVTAPAQEAAGAAAGKESPRMVLNAGAGTAQEAAKDEHEDFGLDAGFGLETEEPRDDEEADASDDIFSMCLADIAAGDGEDDSNDDDEGEDLD